MKVLPLLLAGLLMPIPAFADDARISLDWEGRYEGVLPCDDCDGIRTVLMIDENGSYQMVETYLGKTAEEVVVEGEFAWDESGDRILLDDDEAHEFLVGEGQLVMLNDDGQPGGDGYVLEQTRVPLTKADRPAPPGFDEIVKDGAEFIGGGQNLKILPGSLVHAESDNTGDHHVVFRALHDFEFQMEGGHRSLTATYDINCATGQYDMPEVAYFKGHDGTGEKLFETSDNAGNWLDLLDDEDDALAQAAAAICD